MRVNRSGDPSGSRGVGFGSDETSREFADDFLTRRDDERQAYAARDSKDGRDNDYDEDERPPAREGLPKRFRMRHGRHYVDELLGEAPLRTVREVPISEIEPPPDEAVDPRQLDRLETSIRTLGVLEPLLVARRGLEYRVIAGMRRLRAARTVGLNTVPCLVHDVDDERLGSMREAASDRIAAGLQIEATLPRDDRQATPGPAIEATAFEDVQAAADTGEATYFVAGLPAKGPGVDERLRLAVLTELAGVELFRAKIASAAGDALTRPAPLERSPICCASIVDDALSAVAAEARLRGVLLEKVGPASDVAISLDAPSVRLALTGLLQALLTLATMPHTVLQVRTEITTVRPAVIVHCVVRRGNVDVDAIGDEARARFFDPGWREHPCGEGGALALGALARVARAHGGRVQATASGVMLVVPRPLSDL